MYLDISICSYSYHIIILSFEREVALFVEVSYIHNIGGNLFSGRIGKDVCVCKGNDCEGVWNVNRYELLRIRFVFYAAGLAGVLISEYLC